MTENRRRKDSAKLVWDTKPKRAPNPRDIEFQTAEIVIPNPKQDQGSFDLPLFATPQAEATSPFPEQMGELPLGGQEIDKTQMNRLIWGDNLLAMQALLAQGYAGKVDLIYIDPPFASSADYSYPVTIDGKQVEKEASIIERLAYIDTWEGGLDSYLDMIYPRFQLMKRLLSEMGSLYVHVDWHVSHYIKAVLDEVFGIENFRNEIIWLRTTPKGLATQKLPSNHDVIFCYQKSGAAIWHQNFSFIPYDPDDLREKTASKYCHTDSNGRIYRLAALDNPSADRPNLTYGEPRLIQF